MAPVILSNVSDIVHSSYNLRSETKFRSKNTNPTNYGTKTIFHIGPNILNLLSNDCKSSTTLEEFRANIKKWTPKNCLCKTYIQHSGFVEVPKLRIKYFVLFAFVIN